MKQRPVIIALAIASLFARNDAAAESTKIDLKGGKYQQTATEETTSLTFLAETKGNSTTPVRIVVEGPDGMKVLTHMALKPESPSENPTWTKLQLKSRSKMLKESTSPCVDFAPGESSSETDDVPPINKHPAESPLCDLFSTEEIAALAETLGQVYGGVWSNAEVCGYLVDNYLGGMEDCPEGDPICDLLTQPAALSATYSMSSVSVRREYYTLLHKNACRAKSTRYWLRITVDLTALLPEQRAGATIGVQANEYQFTGDKAATIKPVSDGKFAPQPIILMSFLGTFCGQRINLVKWSSDRPKIAAQIKVEDLVPYKGRILTRSPVGKYLKGGKATFELQNVRSSYGVCFRLERKRQKVNGY